MLLLLALAIRDITKNENTKKRVILEVTVVFRFAAQHKPQVLTAWYVLVRTTSWYGNFWSQSG